MTDNVTYLDRVTTLDIPVDRVLSRAIDEGMELAIVIGLDGDGEFYFSSSVAEGADVLWWLEIAKKRLLEVGDSEGTGNA